MDYLKEIRNRTDASVRTYDNCCASTCDFKSIYLKTVSDNDARVSFALRMSRDMSCEPSRP